MIIDLTYTNANGDILSIANNDDFILTDVDGMTENNNDISTATAALFDGDTITNVRANPRTITIYCQFYDGVNVESAKRAILQVVKPKQTGLLTYIHGDRTLTIEATVEKIALPRFSDKCVMQITFYCSFPFWRDAEAIVEDIRRVLALHHFPFAITANKPLVFGKIGGQTTRAIVNDGDVAVGMNIRVIATGNYTNPTIQRGDGAFFGVDVTMSENDVLEINTVRGNKYVRLNGVNQINKIISGSTWLQLDVGLNEFTLSGNPELIEETITIGDTSDTGSNNAYMEIEYKRAFV